MLEINNELHHCNICKHEYTSTHVETMLGIKIYVCENCLEASKYNFIWICMNCSKVYVRPKALVIQQINNPELKRAYMLCMDMRIIQGIDMCISCDPERIVKYMENVKAVAEC
ncbi:MAG: hypothetical protein HZC11_02725 [Nitrospirae bacterium]|nr:hypothetical protein [Nitrospirota bacterium]